LLPQQRQRLPGFTLLQETKYRVYRQQSGDDYMCVNGFMKEQRASIYLKLVNN
jgi:hypothetical protein